MEARRDVRRHGGRREIRQGAEQESRLIPLYRFEGELPKERGMGNLGLWFDKFFDRWCRIEPPQQSDWRKHPQEKRDGLRRSQAGSAIPVWLTQAARGANPKLEWLMEFVGNRGPVGREDLLRESAARAVRLIEARGGRWRVFRTTSRFVTGIGRQHPVENGFAWHPTLGVPYLPGTSVKGVVRAWARCFADGAKSGLILRLFGPDFDDRRKGAECRQGAVAFLDALPVQPPRLVVDVMTPHFANWTGDDPPGDWRSPVPVFFLTTEEGAQFLFGVIPVGEVADTGLDYVLNWLTEALDWVGSGAKTAVGYGRMTRDEAAETELRRRIRGRHLEG